MGVVSGASRDTGIGATGQDANPKPPTLSPRAADHGSRDVARGTALLPRADAAVVRRDDRLLGLVVPTLARGLAPQLPDHDLRDRLRAGDAGLLPLLRGAHAAARPVAHPSRRAEGGLRHHLRAGSRVDPGAGAHDHRDARPGGLSARRLGPGRGRRGPGPRPLPSRGGAPLLTQREAPVPAEGLAVQGQDQGRQLQLLARLAGRARRGLRRPAPDGHRPRAPARLHAADAAPIRRPRGSLRCRPLYHQRKQGRLLGSPRSLRGGGHATRRTADGL